MGTSALAPSGRRGQNLYPGPFGPEASALAPSGRRGQNLYPGPFGPEA